MSRTVRVLAEQELPLHGAAYRPGRMVAVMGVAVAILLMISLVEFGNAFGWYMGGLGLSLIFLLLAMLRFQHSIHEREVTVRTVRSAMAFVPQRGVNLSFAVAGAVGLLPGLVVLIHAGVFSGGPLPVDPSWWKPAIPSLLALAVLVQVLWWSRLPTGLTMSGRGLRGIRGAARVEISWDELIWASAFPSRTGAKLALHRSTGRAIVVEPRWIGSDPNVVAPIVEYYRLHPAERGLLADPTAAIERVEQAARERARR